MHEYSCNGRTEILRRRSCTSARLLNPIPHRRFERGDVDVLQRFELDAVAGHARLAEFLGVGAREVHLVVEPEDVDRDAGRVRAEADLIKIFGLAAGVFVSAKPVADVGIGNDFARVVLPVQEPQFARGIAF